MAKKSELIIHAENEIRRLKVNAQKYRDALMRTAAEIKSYENMIEWSKNAKKETVSTSKRKTTNKS